MAKQDPAPNVVNFEQLRLTGTRTVEVKVRGVLVTVTENLEDDDSVDRELGRARMNALMAGRASQKVLSLATGGEPSEESEVAKADLAKLSDTLESLDSMMTFDRRRVAAARIARRFVAWNLVGPGGPLPLDFDGLYDGPLSVGMLEDIYDAVRSEPIVGEASA